MMELGAYFQRIGFKEKAKPDLATLQRVHRLHRAVIPFENIDIQMGLGVSLALPDLMDKLITRKRGGYCFEQNSLLLAVLQEIGFQVRPLLGRVRWNAADVLPRTHMVLRVELADGSFLADVGFGAPGIIEPLLFQAGIKVRQGFAEYELLREDSLWLLRGFESDAWKDFYVFSEEEQFPIDFEVANHYTSTHPNSQFVKTLTAQIARADERLILRNLTLRTLRASGFFDEDIPSAQLRSALRERFGLILPEGTPEGARFRAFERT
jgi:N-hydroxyarylamine O-acetyltransferase